MRSMTLRVALSLLCTCVWLWTAGARADEAADKAEAERLFKAGVSLQKAEDFNAAIAAFESSLRLHPTKSALFNLANCLQAIHRYPEALSTLESLEREYGGELVEPMKGRVAIQRAELENLTASLTIEVEPAGAEVRVDGKPVGTSPLEGPLRLTLGDHAIEVALAGYATEHRNVNLAPRENAAQSFQLGPEAPAPPAKPLAPAASPPPSPVPAPSPMADGGTTQADDGSSGRLAGWVLLGTGGALLVGGTATGLYALSLDGKLEDDCWEEHCHTSKRSDVNQLDHAVLATNVMLGLGVASAAVGALLLLTNDADASAEPETNVGFTVTPGYVGAGVRRSF